MKCKLGELAFITCAPDIKQNLGKIVRVVELKSFLFAGEVWLCRSQHGPMLTSDGSYQLESYCHDSDLTPIRGEPEKTDETEQTKELERV